MNYIFDLDNTLIYSDAANNLAYKEAVRNVVNSDLQIDGGRITRSDIAARRPPCCQKLLQQRKGFIRNFLTGHC